MTAGARCLRAAIKERGNYRTASPGFKTPRGCFDQSFGTVHGSHTAPILKSKNKQDSHENHLANSFFRMFSRGASLLQTLRCKRPPFGEAKEAAVLPDLLELSELGSRIMELRILVET